MSSLKNAKKFALGASLAAAVGYVAGILTAPKSGKETRQDLKDTANEASEKVEENLQKLHDELVAMINKVKINSSELGGQAKEEFDKLVAKASEAKLKTSEVLTAFKGGKTNDKDLSQAVDQATEAVNHLREYLKK
jgi:gas vesicle protein